MKTAIISVSRSAGPSVKTFEIEVTDAFWEECQRRTPAEVQAMAVSLATYYPDDWKDTEPVSYSAQVFLKPKEGQVQ